MLGLFALSGGLTQKPNLDCLCAFCALAPVVVGIQKLYCWVQRLDAKAGYKGYKSWVQRVERQAQRVQRQGTKGAKAGHKQCKGCKGLLQMAQWLGEKGTKVGHKRMQWLGTQRVQRQA